MNPTSVQDLVSKGFYGYQGWGNAEALADFAKTGGAGKGNAIQQSSQAQSTPSGANLQSNALNFDPVAAAQKFQQFTTASNQPAINTLQGQIDPLKQRYNDLIESIKGIGKTSENFAIQGATGALGARGLLPQSPEGQTQLAQAVLPYEQQTRQSLAQTALNQNQDINTINNAIAQLQTGNPTNAIQTALGLTGQNVQLQGVQNQGSLALAQLAFNQQQAAIQNELARQGLGIQGMNAQTNAGQLGLQQQQFAVNPNNPAAIRQWMDIWNNLPGGGSGAPQSRPPLSSFNTGGR